MGFNKKVLSKAVSELDKAKAPGKPKDIIVDPAGQWKYPGQKTRIPSSDITMQGVNYPVFAQPNVGPGTIMYPNQDYQFPGADYVDETPLAKKGGTLKSKKYSKSMSATNKLFAKNKLFQNKKSKIFDPNAKFKSGGSKLGPINLNPNPLSHYELNYGFNLPVKQDGGKSDYEELELTPEEIQAYKDGGYVVEELPEAQTGGSKFKRTAFDEDAKSNVGWSSVPVEKKKTQPVSQQKKTQQKTFDKNFKVTDKSKYEKTEEKIAEAQKAYVDWTKKTGRTFTDADLKSIADQQWSFAGVGPQQSEDMMRATPEQSSGSRAWEYITNPFTAAEYAISGGGAENMPHNINEMRMAGIDPGVVQGRNMVGNMLNSSLNLFDAGDKVARNVSRGNYGSALLEGLRFAPGSGLLDDAVRLGVKPGAKYLGKALGTESGLLSNAYKYNPKALKEAQEAMLVRARPVGQDPYINMAESLRAKEAAGEPLKWYQKNLLNPQTNPDILAREKYYGQWFADNPSDLDFYINPATRNFADDAQIEILKARMPKSEAAKYNVKNFEDAKIISNLHDSEYILPKNMVQQTERYSVDDLPRLIEEYNQINKPHWLKGYKEVPKKIPGSPNNNVRLEFNPQRSNELNSISHDIHYGNQKVGEVSGNYKSNGDFEISDVGVDKAFQKKGISKQAYNLLNEAHPNNKVVSFGAYNTDAAGMQPGKNLWESLVKEGKAKKVGNSYEMLNSKNVSSELPGSFSPSSGTSGTLNSGISPQLIKNAVGPSNKVAASILNRAYFDPFFNKTLNKISPLNFIPGYGSKLTGAVKPLGNVINRSIKDGNLVESKNLLQQAKGLLKKTDDADLTTKMNKSNTDIYSAKIDDSVQGSNVGLGTANKQGVLGRTFNKSNAVYPLQTKTGNPLNKVPLSDPGVSLHRRLPFSNRYVPIDKQKLLNNKFQWSTTGAGLQNVGEKFVKALPTYGLIGGAGAAALYNPYDYMPAESAEFIKENNIPLEDITDLPTRTDAFKEGFKSSLISPTQFLAEPDPHGVRFYGSLLGYSQGGNVITEEWEDELDDYTIELLRKAGYVVKEID